MGYNCFIQAVTVIVLLYGHFWSTTLGDYFSGSYQF